MRDSGLIAAMAMPGVLAALLGGAVAPRALVVKPENPRTKRIKKAQRRARRARRLGEAR